MCDNARPDHLEGVVSNDQSQHTSSQPIGVGISSCSPVGRVTKEAYRKRLVQALFGLEKECLNTAAKARIVAVRWAWSCDWPLSSLRYVRRIPRCRFGHNP